MTTFDDAAATGLPWASWRIGPGDLDELTDLPGLDATSDEFLAAVGHLRPSTGRPAPKPGASSPGQGRSAGGGPDHWALLAGANLGFTDAQAEAILHDHASLVFLGRLWDSARSDGMAVGNPRVPEAIWDLADAPGGAPMAALLEATGLRCPIDFGQQLSFHLALWNATPVQSVRGTAADAGAAVRHDGSISVEARPAGEGIAVELRCPFAGRFEVELHWPDGWVASHFTPLLRKDQHHVFTVPVPQPASGALPASVRVTRRADP